MELWLIRDTFGPDYTLGKMYVDQVFLGHTCEDFDCHLEEHPEDKVYGRTAIPVGRYEVTLTHSQRFGKVMPLLVDVPGFSGIRIHGGNSAADTLGCPLLGRARSRFGVFDCKETNQRLIAKLEQVRAKGGKAFITIGREHEWPK